MPTFHLPDDFTVTDEEFRASKLAQEAVYRDEGGRQAERTYLDALGHARWDTDYVTLRMAGYSHPGALQEMRVRIREAWLPSPLPALEPHVPPPAPPPPPPVVDVPGVRDNMDRFATHYGVFCGSTGRAPNATSTRESRVQLLRDAVLSYRAATGDRSFVMKRADAGRPIGDDVVVFITPGSDYRRYWDFIPNAGLDTWALAVHGGGDILDPGQILVDPDTLQNMLG